MTGRQRQVSEMGARILAAIAAAGETLTGAQRKAGFSTGNLIRIVYGERGEGNINPARMKALADLLGVNFEWLVLGTGPRLRSGGPTQPAATDLSEGQRDVLRAYLLDKLEELEPGSKSRLHQEPNAVPDRQKPGKKK